MISIVVFGALGGTVSWLRRLELRSQRSGTTRWEYVGDDLRHRSLHGWGVGVLIVRGLLVGIAGAFAVIGFMLFATSFQLGTDSVNMLILYFLSVVGGFGARELLPALSQSIRQKIQKAERSIQEQSAKLERTKQVIELGQLVTEARKELEKFDEVSPRAREAKVAAIKELEEAFRVFPESQLLSDGGAAIVYGCILARLDHFDAAQDFLSELLRKEGLPKRERAVAFYNRACYRVHTGQTATDVLGDLKEAGKLSPGILVGAETDEHLTAFFKTNQEAWTKELGDAAAAAGP